MKKRCLSLVALLAVTHTSFSQSALLPQLLRGPRMPLHQTALDGVLRNQQPTSAKTTAPTQRLIGYSAKDALTNDIVDSSRMIYNSPLRGSDHSGNDLSSYYFTYDPRYMNWQPVENFLQGGGLRIKADSVIMQDVDGLYMTSGLTYNMATQPTSFRSNYYSSGIPDGRDRYTMTYNSAGQQTLLFYEIDTVTSSTPGPFMPTLRMFSTYGGTPSRALRDSTVYDPAAPFTAESERAEFTYVGNNLSRIDYYVADTGVFQLVQQINFSYDASNRVRIVIASVDFGTGLQPFIKDSLTYTGSYTYPTATFFSLNNTGTSFDPLQSVRYTLNAQGLRDTMRVYDGSNTLMNTIAYQYNSYGNPDGYRVYLNSGGGGALLQEIGRYYYEIHDPTSVSDAGTQALQVTAYPNPVQNTLALTWKAGTGRATIRVTDGAGRMLEQTVMGAGVSAHTLDMSRYAPGTYFVSIADADGVAKHLKVSKQ